MAGETEVEVKLRVSDLAALRKRLARLKARPGAAGRVHEMNYLFDTPQGGLAKHGQLLRIRVEVPEQGRRNARRRGKEAGRQVARESDRHGLEAILTYKGPSERLDEVPTPGPSAGAQAEACAMGAVGGAHGTQAEACATGAVGGAPAKACATQGRYKVREEIEVTVADPGGLKAIFEALGLRGWFRYEKFRTTYQLPASRRWARDLAIELDETPVGVFLELEGSPAAIDQAAALLGYNHGDYITKSYLQLYLEQCRKQGIPSSDMVFATKNSAKI